jgi:hypothetical protein
MGLKKRAPRGRRPDLIEDAELAAARREQLVAGVLARGGLEARLRRQAGERAAW